MLEHKQIYIICPWSGEEVGIDEDIVELIKELWRLDIRTTTCCQDASRGKRPGKEDVWIDFEYDTFPLFAGIISETVGVEWHIMPRTRRTTGRLQPAKYRDVIGVSFPSQYYDRILSYFKNGGRLIMKRYLVDYGRINGSMLHPLKADNLEDAKKEAVKLTPSWRGVCVTIYELSEVAVVYLDEDRPHDSIEQDVGVEKLNHNSEQ